ncbi:hypothetical protein J6590_071060 [Homalodisca vitripennis]|nr:hypothetical protein J6590_071060 [Homalodisca vitripennis]
MNKEHKQSVQIKKRKNRNKKRTSDSQANCLAQVSTKESLSYPVIRIERDSHCRHPWSLGSSVILIAGTNDVEEGVDKIIYKHLEGRLVNLLVSSSRIIFASPPHHHDLPSKQAAYSPALLSPRPELDMLNPRPANLPTPPSEASNDRRTL